MSFLIPAAVGAATTLFANSKSGKKFLGGSPGKVKNVSTLTDQQQPLHQQLLNAAQGEGAGGVFGQSADYYRNLLSDNSADYQSFADPTMREYNEDIVPSLSEQFAGMGSGGLSSSGFRNAQIQGATSLAERLGAIRAQLRQTGAQGLMNIGQSGLNPVTQQLQTDPGSQGFASSVAPGIGAGIGKAIGNYANNWMNQGSGSSGGAASGAGSSGPYQQSGAPPSSVWV